MGGYSPLTTPAKIIIQELWKRNVGWDDQVPPDLLEQWKSVATALENVEMELPRSYLGSGSAVQQLHVFVDASKVAYGAAAYLTHDDRSVLVLSKSKVAPLKILGREKPTIPLLEIMAAVLGTEIASTIIRVFRENGINVSVTLWSDNQAVLYQIHQSNPHKCQVVENRTKKIKTFNNAHNAIWRYVPTASNPADLLTRGISLDHFHSSSLWRSGPEWLAKPADHPTWDVGQHSSLAVHFVQSVPVAPLVVEMPETNISAVINPMKFNWQSLLRVTVYVRRFCNKLLAKWRKNRESTQQEPQRTTADQSTDNAIVASDILEAELLWIRTEQAKFLQTELAYLRSGTGYRPSLVSQCDLFLDKDGIVRCGGRLRFSHLSQGTRHPIFIPRQSPIAELVIRFYHERIFHSGVGNTVNSIRQRYWITCAVQTVKSVLRTCCRCRREEGHAYVGPDHATLPDFRTMVSYPFTATGIDYTGAFEVTTDQGDAKAYVVLFTCAASRAIHLELVNDATAKSFIQAFRRFVSHHSLPKKVVTDNGTNLVAGNKIIQELLNNEEVRRYLTGLLIEVFTIPAGAPWQGGFYERLIGIVKSALKKAIGRTKLTFEELRTLVAEVRAVVNDRPLTKVSIDVNEKDALTPSHLMHGRRLTSSLRSDSRGHRGPRLRANASSYHRRFHPPSKDNGFVSEDFPARLSPEPAGASSGDFRSLQANHPSWRRRFDRQRRTENQLANGGGGEAHR